MVEYEEIRAHVLATAQSNETLAPSGRSHTPITREHDMDMDNNQDPSSSGERLQNDSHSAMAEFDRVAAAYNVASSVVNDARAFVRVRIPCFSLRIVF